jgi:4-aminobutyrate aminotransferase / (S)-3-amino-2-methylpropionate transaminase / 5-aminovalerate transaminase
MTYGRRQGHSPGTPHQFLGVERMSSIKLVTEVPGPKSQEMVARRAAATAVGAAYLTELGIASGAGAVVTDVDGNQLLDFAGGIGVLAVGHSAPAVTAAMQKQAAELIHMCAIVATYEPYLDVVERLNTLTPGDFPKKSVLLNSGAEGVETAIKIARAATGRAGILVFEGAYHGRTNLTLGMTSKYGLFKKSFGPFSPEIYRIPFPNVSARPVEMNEEAFIDWSISRLHEAMMAQIDPGSLAAIVIEPVQGEGGFIPAPARYLQAIRDICDQHGVVMIADEVQSGFGRTGKLFAVEHSNVAPDLIVMAKSLAAGMPLAAVTGKAEIMDAPHAGGLGGTYSGNPLACVAAREAIDMITGEGFLDRANAVGARLRAGLEVIADQHPGFISEVRGLGPMLAIEIVKDGTTPDPDSTLAINKATIAQGLITIRAGLYSNCVRFLPPLNITDDQIDEALGIIEKAVAEVASARVA